MLSVKITKTDVKSKESVLEVSFSDLPINVL